MLPCPLLAGMRLRPSNVYRIPFLAVPHAPQAVRDPKNVTAGCTIISRYTMGSIIHNEIK